MTLDNIRQSMREALIANDAAVERVIADAALDDSVRQAIAAEAVRLVEKVRAGLSTGMLESFLAEYSLSNNINGIRNIESQTMYGVSVIKVYFQPDVNLDLAIAQCVASVNWIRAVMPPTARR